MGGKVTAGAFLALSIFGLEITLSTSAEGLMGDAKRPHLQVHAASRNTPHTRAAAPLLAPSFAGPDGLITNEWAFWNPDHHEAVKSADWEMDSGSLFRQNGMGWTGRPDGTGPDPASRIATDSAIFRLNTKRRDFENVIVTVELRNQGLTTTPRTPAVDWDGAHVWLRYQNQASLYYASVQRRDGHVVIKKKCLGGNSNGGTYYTLAEKSGFPIPFGAWQSVSASVRTETDSSVSLTLGLDGRPILRAIDRGSGCSPILNPGAVGLRGDNADLLMRAFTVRSIG